MLKSPLWVRHFINWHISKSVGNECSSSSIPVSQRTSLFQTQFKTQGDFTSQNQYVWCFDWSPSFLGFFYTYFSQKLYPNVKNAQVFSNRSKNVQRTQYVVTWWTLLKHKLNCVKYHGENLVITSTYCNGDRYRCSPNTSPFSKWCNYSLSHR
jgi:hypothetical protein